MNPVNPADFEAINKHVEAHLPQAQKAHAAAPGGDPKAAAATNLCTTYATVKPIVLLVSMFPFFPKSWQTGLGLFIKALDAVCPAGQVNP